MSGPQEHAGVEDVLSSIRRLVSEENRTARPVVSERATNRRPRLVLTPALRVAPLESGTDLPVNPLVQAEAEELDQTIEHDSTLEAHDQGSDAGEQEPASSDVMMSSSSETKAPSDTREGHIKAFMNGSPTVEHAASVDMFGLQKHGKSAAASEVPTALDTMAHAEKVAADEGATDAASQNAPWTNPNATLYNAVDGSAEHSEEGAAELTTSIDEAADEADAMDAASVTPLHNATARQRAAAVVRKIAEMEAATPANGAANEVWEPDACRTGPFAAESRKETAQPWEAEQPETEISLEEEMTSVPEAEDLQVDRTDANRDLVAEVVEASADGIEQDLADATLANLKTSEEAALLDEESLREMVVEIVRSELQGALGEKITRNVRKLVRREIQRALATHEIL